MRSLRDPEEKIYGATHYVLAGVVGFIFGFTMTTIIIRRLTR